MYASQCRKCKVELTDYNFERDLASRLLLSNLSDFEVDLLKEIVFNSLSFPVEELCETLEAAPGEVVAALERLEPTALFSLSDSKLHVNKERRKYFEVQIERFEEDFCPDTSFFFSLLHLVPIEVLPTWYSVSKTTDDIFGSIIDKFHRTTKLFERYLAELHFDDEPLNQLIALVYGSKELVVDVPTLLEKLEVSREKLEEYLILLEFHKVCCLNYRSDENHGWRQEVTPFYEWRKYQLFLQKTECKKACSAEEVDQFFGDEFGFIRELDKFLSSLLDKPLSQPSIEQYDSGYYSLEEMGSRIFERVCHVNVTKEEEGMLMATENALMWLKKPIQEKAMALYFSTIHKFRKGAGDSGYNDRDIREIERGLKRIIDCGFVPFEEFVKGLTASLGGSHEIELKKKGRYWYYAIPQYNPQQLTFIRQIIYHHLLESGMVAVAQRDGEPYLAVTDFGRMALGD